MPINLAEPLAWKKATADELKMLQALQGNILKGHGREHTANIFFQLDPAKPLESRRMLRDLANYHLTSAYRQLLDTEQFKCDGKSGGPFTALALSFKGYQALGLAAKAPADPDFRKGMKHQTSIDALNDPVVAQWEPKFQEKIHGMALAAAATESETGQLAGTIETLINKAGGTVVHVQHGRALKNAAGKGIEHFGYVDGRSQPLMLHEDIEDEAMTGGTARWDPAFPLGAALVKDPGVTDPNIFGSLFVFRKLEQHVRDFKTREQEVADILVLKGNDDRERAGAFIVGRYEDGTPITLSDHARAMEPPNDFNYEGDVASRCPFHGHIRKVNPRGTAAAERQHIMPRRGIPYEDLKREFNPAELPDSDDMAEFLANVAPKLPVTGVGLLFMAYNASIAQQFRFVQHSWANDTTFPGPGNTGIDPVIGQTANNPGDQKLPKEWDNPAAGSVNNGSFAGFVKMKGGEYMFAPSLTFLSTL